MAYASRELSGSSFKNDRKRPDKKDADYAGSALIDGVEYWLDTWIKNRRTLDDGSPNPEFDPAKKTFLSHSFRPKEQSRAERPATQRTATRPPPPPPGASTAEDRDPDGNYKF